MPHSKSLPPVISTMVMSLTLHQFCLGIIFILGVKISKQQIDKMIMVNICLGMLWEKKTWKMCDNWWAWWKSSTGWQRNKLLSGQGRWCNRQQSKLDLLFRILCEPGNHDSSSLPPQHEMTMIQCLMLLQICCFLS